MVKLGNSRIRAKQQEESDSGEIAVKSQTAVMAGGERYLRNTAYLHSKSIMSDPLCRTLLSISRDLLILCFFPGSMAQKEKTDVYLIDLSIGTK